MLFKEFYKLTIQASFQKIFYINIKSTPNSIRVVRGLYVLRMKTPKDERQIFRCFFFTVTVHLSWVNVRHRSALPVQRSPLPVYQPSFTIHRSPFSVHRSAEWWAVKRPSVQSKEKKETFPPLKDLLLIVLTYNDISS